MEPRPELRERLARVGGFIQNTPTDGAAATERTVVWLARTRTALYVVFVCFDNQPELIRSHLARRENILNDDYVSVVLDPFQDRRRGVEFQVNPRACRRMRHGRRRAERTTATTRCGIRTGGSRSRDGWRWLRFRFAVCGFRRPERTWGVVFWRNLPRNSENDWWPRVSAGVSGMLSQEGTMYVPGIEGVEGSHNVQINPYVLGQNEHTLETLDPNNPYFSTRNAEATAGGEAKAVWKDAIVFDATVNPDFSDVESDQPQFTVNQRYPVYFPELRPFFLENASYFRRR